MKTPKHISKYSLILLIIIAISFAVYYQWERHNALSYWREFNEPGLSFQIPEHIFHTDIVNENLHTFRFYAEGNMISDTSSVTISIPVEKSMPSDYDPATDIPTDAIKSMVNWGPLQGDRYVYHYLVEKTKTNGGWEGIIIKEIYPLSNSRQYLVLQYDHSIHDDTLETLWSRIHTEAKMDFADNLPNYQSYTIQSAKVKKDTSVNVNEER